MPKVSKYPGKNKREFSELLFQLFYSVVISKFKKNDNDTLGQHITPGPEIKGRLFR